MDPVAFFRSLADSVDANLLQEQRYLLILGGLKVTAVISVGAIALGSLLGGLICRMRMARYAWLVFPAKAYIAIIRGIPLPVMLMLAYYVVFASVNISPVWVAIAAFAATFAAYAAEIYRAGIESIDHGQQEAGLALGFTRVQAFTHIIAPQALCRILPVYKGEVINLVKMTSVVGFIAVQDLTRTADIIRSRTFDAFFPLVMVAVLYFMISWLLLISLTGIETRLQPRRRSLRRAFHD